MPFKEEYWLFQQRCDRHSEHCIQVKSWRKGAFSHVVLAPGFFIFSLPLNKDMTEGMNEDITEVSLCMMNQSW